MPLTEQDRAKLIAIETSKFLDDGFGQLDTSSFPHLNPLPDAKFEAHDKHGLSNVIVNESSGLRALADNPDAETLQRLSIELNDPDLAEKIRDDQEAAIAVEFVRTHPSYHKSDWNYERLRDYLEDKQQDFTLENLHAAFLFLTRTGQLETKPGTARELDESDLLNVINAVKNGDLETGVGLYLDAAFPGAADTWDSSEDFIQDVRTVAARNKATRFVWFHSRPDVDDTREFRQFEGSFFRLRPVRTVADYDAAYSAFEKRSKEVFRDSIIHDSKPPTAENLDELSDSEIETLTQRSLRSRAQQMKRERRGL
jgi:hypothetical protein